MERPKIGLNIYHMLPLLLGKRWRTPLRRSGEKREITDIS